ncbi:MAG: sulfatase [Rikenellaceae bacterium]
MRRNNHRALGLTKGVVLTTAATVTTVLSAAAASADERPNIIVIMADDLDTSELSCYGGQNLTTPNIDRLAEQGLRFTNNFASTAMSVPIRASLYTGLYPARHGSYQNHKFTFEGTQTVNDYLPELGYRVARAGKQHPSPKWVYNFRELSGFLVNCVADYVPFSTDGIEEFISESDDPFLLYVCSTNPHAPWNAGDPSEFNASELVLPPNMVDNASIREIYTKYLAEVRELDNEVGGVVAALDRCGKSENTIIIFLGEQGPQFPGGKWSCWGNGLNSAMIATHPSFIDKGVTTDALVQYEDILPTLIDIAEGKAVKNLDGKSFKKVLYGKSDSHREWAYGIHNNYPEGNPYPIRSIRDGRYALIVNLTPEVQYHEKHLMPAKGKSNTGVWEAWCESQGSGEEFDFLNERYLHRPAMELYDLEVDPEELDNLAERPEHQKRIAKMSRELYKWMEQQGDTGVAMDVPFENPKKQTK